MKEAGYIPKEAWKPFVESLTRRFQVYAPCKEGDTVAFERLSGDKSMCLDRPAQCAPKAVIFPQSETLFSFSMKKDADQPQKTDVELAADTAAADTMILCGRPCDAKGFSTLDPVYLAKDPYYRERREKTTIITLACPHGFPGCFCTSVDSGPADKKDSDVLITELDEGYYVEALTDKGQTALKDANLQDGAAYKGEAEAKQADAERQVKKAFEGGKNVKISAETFQSDEFWEEVSAKCISCGACTYLCPTCYCFNITDEQAIDTGERIRSWDSCMFPHYTLETSGHNPRTKKAQRLKNRIGHKFVYYPELYHELLCSGCGRCIRHCPVSVEISRIVARMTEPSSETAKGARS
jgi:sulfhydrogenase subunit beta (sulfur reductase)